MAIENVGTLIEKFPRKNQFPGDMPRYPNLWFLVDVDLPVRPQFHLAVRSLVEILERYLGLTDDFASSIHSQETRAALGAPGEGADFQARIGPLQYVIDTQRPERSHWHQFHARFYPSATQHLMLTLPAVGGKPDPAHFFAIPASVHYEVATEEPLHPYVDSCTVCGITGAYDLPIRDNSQDYCVRIHDPLGLEFILEGKIRGSHVHGNDKARVSSINSLRSFFDCSALPLQPLQDEPTRMGVVVLRPYHD